MGKVVIVLIISAVLSMVMALTLGWPLLGRDELDRWVNRVRPRALLAGRARSHRITVGLLIVTLVLSVAVAIIGIFWQSNAWYFFLGIILPVESLILLDMLQHRAPEPVP